MSTYNITVPAPDPDIVVEIGAGATTIAELTDKATIDLPTINTPLSEALAAKLEEIPTATDTILGGVKIGSGVSIDVNGVISVSTDYAAKNHTHVSADITDATDNDTAGTIVKRNATYGHVEITSSVASKPGVSAGNTAGGSGVSGTATSGSAVKGEADSGTGTTSLSMSGTGSTASTSSGDYHSKFGPASGDNRSFVARILGAFGWWRGAYKLTVSAVDTLTANRVQRFQDKDGTVALTSDIANRSIEIQLAASDETSALTIGDGKVVFRAPVAFTLTGVRASVTTEPTGATLQVQIRNAGNDVLSTKLSIDASEKTSTTAATPAVINATYDDFADDAEIHIDLDQVGSTIAGTGLKITLLGTRA